LAGIVERRKKDEKTAKRCSNIFKLAKIPPLIVEFLDELLLELRPEHQH
jgi:hypothetical protein